MPLGNHNLISTQDHTVLDSGNYTLLEGRISDHKCRECAKAKGDKLPIRIAVSLTNSEEFCYVLSFMYDITESSQRLLFGQ